MRATPFVLALVTAGFWATAPLLGKLGWQRVEPSIGLTVRSCVVSLVLLGWLFFRGHFTDLAAVDLRSGLLLSAEGISASLP